MPPPSLALILRELVSGLQALLRDLRTLPTGKLSKLLVAIHLGQKIDKGKAAFARVNSLLVAAPNLAIVMLETNTPTM